VTDSAEVVMLAHALGTPRDPLSVHGSDERDRPLGFPLRDEVLEAALVPAVDSLGRSQQFRWLGHTRWHRTRVAQGGLPTTFHQDACVAPYPQEPPLVRVGQQCKRVGQLLLREVAHRLREAGRRLSFVLAGDDEMQSCLERTSQIRRLVDQTASTGWRSDQQAREDSQQSRATVLPPSHSGSPVAIRRSMAFAPPAISTLVAMLSGLVRQGTDGGLLPASNVDALAQALASFLDTPNDRLRRLRVSARARADERPAIDVEASKSIGHVMEST
jgi:colanic acid/amylovoran biosynthesis glycosyltransferase